jgi:4-amino-4-deoxychorismate lyase
MYCILNDQLFLENSLPAHHFQRGFAYGDGLFETCLFANGTVHLFDAHITRLRTGCQILSLIPDQIAFDHLAQNIALLVKENQLGNFARIKITLVRESEGLYAPTSDNANILITASPSKGIEQTVTNADISRKVLLQSSAWSSLKTTNALPYVLAGIEKRNRGLGEILISNTNGKAVESGSGNLIVFNEVDQVIGLVDPRPFGIKGVMFQEISDWVMHANLPYEVNPVYQQSFQRLQRATSILCCNSLRLTWINKLGNTTLDPAPLQKILAPFLAQIPLAQ